MNKALKIKIPDFLSRTKAIKLHDWYVNKMPDWWWYKAIRSGEEGEDVEYIELNFGNISEIENKKILLNINLNTILTELKTTILMDVDVQNVNSKHILRVKNL